MCLSARRPCGLHEAVNARLQAGNRAYHDIAVDVFDDKVADVLDGSIGLVFVQRPGFTGRVLCWIRMHWGE